MSNWAQIGRATRCSTENIVSSDVIKHWVETYLRAALEADSQKMPGRIVTARDAIAERLKDLEGNSDHHAERHEMQSALAALTGLEDETSIWPTPATAHQKITKLRNNTPISKRGTRALRKATPPPLEHAGATADSDRAKRPPLAKPPATDAELTPGDRVEGLGNFGKPTGEIGTVERTNEEDALVKWDDDGRVRLGQPWLKKI